MKNLLVFGLVLISVVSCNDKEPLVLSECMQSKIEEILDGEVWNPPAKIYSYEYGGEEVYYVSARCCDFFGEVYTADCEYVCAADGGITGTGDGNCADFFETATNEKLVWQDPRGHCVTPAIVNEEKYKNAAQEYGTILNAEIHDDCLYIEFGASGCSGKSWTWSLVDLGLIAESLPEQRSIKFSLKNKEMCAAYFEKEVSFDISNLQISGSNEIILHLDDYEEALTYEY